jgi:hydroxymethylpyrimidine/phosphomethylpyrimidine kinase
MVSTSGHSLARREVAAALTRHLLPLATLVTPNIPEAEMLLGECLLGRWRQLGRWLGRDFDWDAAV